MPLSWTAGPQPGAHPAHPTHPVKWPLRAQLISALSLEASVMSPSQVPCLGVGSLLLIHFLYVLVWACSPAPDTSN
jgi:hypothetical protein